MMLKLGKSPLQYLLSTFALFILVAAAHLCVGQISFSELTPEIFMALRLPRTLAGIAAGGGLTIAGIATQALSMNPIADASILGIAAAAALGSVLGQVLGLKIPSEFSSLILACMMSLVCASFLLRWARLLDFKEVLLRGLVLSFIFSSLATLLLMVSNPAVWQNSVPWLLGDLGLAGIREATGGLATVLVSSIFIYKESRALDLLSIHPELAATAGVESSKLQRRITVWVSILTAVVVMTAGMIGFIGLMVPHFLRRVGVLSHMRLFPLGFMAGATFLLLCDLGSRLVFQPLDIPVGVLMSLIGGVSFLFILRGTTR